MTHTQGFVEMRFKSALCALGLALLISGCGGGAGTSGSGGSTPGTTSGRRVMGYVTYAGAPVAGATVQVVGVVGSSTTATDGFFDIRGVSPGTQVLSVSAPGKGNLQKIIFVPEDTEPVHYVSLSGGSGGDGGGGSGDSGGPPPPPIW